MDPKEFADAIGAESLGTFEEIVTALSPERRRACARHFEVAVSTVDRWAKGTARPHPLIKKQIVDWAMRNRAN